MRIALIAHEEEGWGGIGTYTAVLARGLGSLGHDVHVVLRGWGEEGVEEREGVSVHRVAVAEPSWRLGTRTLSERLWESRDILAFARAASETIGSIASSTGLDVVESPDFRAQGLVTRLRHRRIPLVVKLHTPAALVDPLNEPGRRLDPDRRLAERLERALVRRARLVTAPSRALAERVAAHWGIAQESIRIVPHPLDAERFASAAPDAPHEPARVICVGRLERIKGVETLIEAVPRILAAAPEARIELVGEDDPSGHDGASMLEHLRRRLAELGVPDEAVQFRGAVDRAELPRLYARAAVSVVPSLWEGFPYGCLEAMAAGCAVVAGAAGGLPEVVRDGEDGLLVPPGDPRALGDAVAGLLRDASLRARVGEQARRSVRDRFDQEPVSEATARLYAEVASRRRRG